MATRIPHSSHSAADHAERGQDSHRAREAVARRWREAILGVAFVIAAVGLRALDDDVAAWLFVGVVAIAVVAIIALRERLAAGELEVLNLARRDSVTGVGNDRALRERLSYEVTRHERHERFMCLLLLDLDDFERVNERLGHVVGNQVLRAVGEALTSAVRTEDTVARHGGDEFSIIAPDVNAAGAPLLARRIDRALAGVAAGGEQLSASIGWAVYPDDGITPEELLLAAKAAEVEAKRSQRGLADGTHGGRVVQLRPPSERDG